MRSWWMLAAAVLAAGCDDGSSGTSRQDCEALIAHLIVLEKVADEGSAGPMCKYHLSCDGSQAMRFLSQCPHVVSKKTLRCYQRATSITEADDCLSRVELDSRIADGGDDHGGDEYGGHHPDWLGHDHHGGLSGLDRRGQALHQLDLLIRDACACHDATCARGVETRLSTLADKYEDLKGDPTLMREAQDGAERAIKCITSAMSSDIDAGAPGGVVPPACQEYLDVSARYQTCDKIPQAARDALRDGLDSMRRTWSDLSSVPDYDRQSAIDSANEACQSASDALRQSLDAVGC